MFVYKFFTSYSRLLWIIFTLKFLESFADFATSLNLVIYLRDHFKFSDVAAGSLYSAWGLSIGICGILLGPVIDRLGVRNALLVGGSLNLVGRILFGIASGKGQLLVALLVLQATGMAMAIPVLTIAIRRVTTDENRSAVYGFFYVMMNVAALFSSVATDVCITYFNNRIGIFTASVVFTFVYVLIVYAYFPSFDHVVPTTTYNRVELREIFSDPVFVRLVIFTLALFGAHSVFRFQDTAFPTWMERTVSAHAHYGLINAINPTIVIAGVTPVQAYLAKYCPYDVIRYGTVLTAAGTFVLFAFKASYASAAAFIVITSLGEIVHSPKHMEYSMLMAPPGKEGIYGTLATAPLFVVRLVTGSLSGTLLATYCAPDDTHNCKYMWLVIALLALSTPIILTCLRFFLYSQHVRDRVLCAKVDEKFELTVDLEDEDLTDEQPLDE